MTFTTVSVPDPHARELPTPGATVDNELRIVVVDVETTGLDPRCERIIEVALVEIDRSGRVLEEFSSLVDIPGSSEPGAGFIHGIDRSMLAGAPRFSDLVDHLAKRLSGRIIAGHVVSFDLGHLDAEFRRSGRELPELGDHALCTRELAGALLPPGPRNLGSCCLAAGIPVRDAHSALGDARTTAALLVELLDRSPEGDLVERARRAAAIEWPRSGHGDPPPRTKRRIF